MNFTFQLLCVNFASSELDKTAQINLKIVF